MLQEAGGTIKVQVLCSQNLVRLAFRKMVESRDGFSVIGDEEAASQADVLLLDIDANGYAEEVQPGDAKVIALASAALPDSFNRALKAGAQGLVLKEQSLETLFKAIAHVHAGEIWFDRKRLAGLIQKNVTATDSEKVKLNQLTRREVEVVRLVGAGLRNKQIAERLFISERTVRSHLEVIFHKLKVKDRVELAIWSVKIDLNQAQPTTRQKIGELAGKNRRIRR